jgi:predicted AAA+ superfamily ATPase
MNTIKVENAILSCEYSFSEIAEMFNMSVADVELISEEMIKQELEDSMDGDFDSAMSSAGFGTDEDYGYYGEEY